MVTFPFPFLSGGINAVGVAGVGDIVVFCVCFGDLPGRNACMDPIFQSFWKLFLKIVKIVLNNLCFETPNFDP